MFDASAPAEVVSRFREGFIASPPRYRMPDLDFRHGIDYASLDAAPESYKWWLNGFQYLRGWAGAATRSDRLRVRAVVDDWQAQNCRPAPASSRAWDGHAAALRAQALTEFFATGEAWLAPLLDRHVEFLLDEAHYQGAWNHGLDQAMALVDLGVALARPEAARVGADRLLAALQTVVDDEGVTVEQSINYQSYNHWQVGQALQRLDALGVELPPEWHARHRRMEEFLAHATRPDGHYFCLGDTLLQPALGIPGTVAEYAATQGRAGPRPAERVKVYRAGYAFGRSGWGERRPMAQESAFALRFGPPRAIHGHVDHMSICYVARGVEVLRDGGFHGYTADGVRPHLRTAQAHNVVVAAEPRRRMVNVATPMTRCTVEPGYARFRLEDAPYAGVTRRRDVVFFFEPECIVVMDSLVAPAGGEFRQLWHFGARCRLALQPDGSYRDAALGLTVRQLWTVDDWTYLPAGSGEPVALCAGDEMFSTVHAPTLVGSRSGRQVAFLTVFAFDDDGQAVDVIDRPLRAAGIRRRLTLRGRRATAVMRTLDSGEIECEVVAAVDRGGASE